MSTDDHPLAAHGWNARWAALLATHPGCEAVRVLRHDGAAVLVALADRTASLPLTRRLDPPPTVGDWLAVRDGVPIAVLDRATLLRRAGGAGEGEQALAANVDLVLLVCGLDRPVKAGRIERGAALAWDAGARPVIVLTKADAVPDAAAMATTVAAEHPMLDLHCTSVENGTGLDALRTAVAGHTLVLLGESGAGKSSLANALLERPVARIGDVRAGDAKGRHTTTSRELYLMADGGSLIDTPGIRAVGLGAHDLGVDAAYDDIGELAAGCRFVDCTHRGEPDCAVRAAVDAGLFDPARLARFHELRDEAAAAARRADPVEQHRYERRFGRMTKAAKRHPRGG